MTDFPGIIYLKALAENIPDSLLCHGKALCRLIQPTVTNLVKHMSKNYGYYFLTYQPVFILSFRAV